jgi:hypothetical protein
MIRVFALQVVGILFTLSIDISTLELGLQMYSIGVGIQQVFILIFALLLWRFNRVLKRENGDWERQKGARRLLKLMIISLTFISVSPRNIEIPCKDQLTAIDPGHLPNHRVWRWRPRWGNYVYSITRGVCLHLRRDTDAGGLGVCQCDLPRKDISRSGIGITVEEREAGIEKRE